MSLVNFIMTSWPSDFNYKSLHLVYIIMAPIYNILFNTLISRKNFYYMEALGDFSFNISVFLPWWFSTSNVALWDLREPLYLLNVLLPWTSYYKVHTWLVLLFLLAWVHLRKCLCILCSWEVYWVMGYEIDIAVNK